MTISHPDPHALSPGRTPPAVAIPATVKPYKRSAVFTETTVPKGFLRNHSTRDGVWGVIHVVSGSLRFSVPSTGHEEILTPSRTGIAEPTVTHRVTPLGSVSFYIEFWR